MTNARYKTDALYNTTPTLLITTVRKATVHQMHSAYMDRDHLLHIGAGKFLFFTPQTVHILVIIILVSFAEMKPHVSESNFIIQILVYVI